MVRKELNTVNNIYKYDDYRKFIEDFIDENQSINSWYSKRYFAKVAEFKSHSHINYILTGARNATPASIEKILSVLKLDEAQTTYFVNLIKYNQAKTDLDREKYFSILSSIRQKIEYIKLDKPMVEFYSKWYHAIIRELVVYSNWKGDYKKLSKMVEPEISTREAEESVKLLLKLELVKEDNDLFVLHSPAVESGDIPINYLKKARKDMIVASINAAEKTNPSERFYNNLTLSVDRQRYDIIRKLTEEYVENIESAVMAQDDTNLERVYQFNIQMFPLSKVFIDEK